MANITIRDLYDRLESNRLENSIAIDRLIERIDKHDLEFRNELEKISREIYGEGESKGVKHQVITNTAHLASIDKARGVSEWRSFIVTMVASLTAAIAGASFKQN